MRLGITHKIVLLTASAVVVSALVVLVSGRLAFQDGFSKEYDAAIAAFARVGEDRVANVSAALANTAKTQAVRPNVVAGLATGNAAQLSQFAKDILSVGQADGVVFSDASGAVVASAGDATGLEEALAKAQAKIRAGGESAGFVAVSGDRLPFLVSVPVRRDGAVVGMVSLVDDLATGNALVDALGRILGVEATLFSGARRVSTTIVEHGGRAVGTLIEDAEVKDRVLGRGETVFKHLRLFGRPFIAVYWPLADASGRPAGIGFVGKSMDELTNTLSSVTRAAGLSALAAVALLGGLAVWASRLLTRPVIAQAA